MRKPTLKCSKCEAPMWEGKGAKNDGTQTCRTCRKEAREQGHGPRACTCGDCGTEFTTTGKAQRLCSTCRHEAMKARAALKGPCTIEGCNKPQFCKKMCNTHYWREREKINPITREYTGACAFCGNEFTSPDPRTKHCSVECGLGTYYGFSNSTEIVLYRSAARKARYWAGQVVPARVGAPLVAGPCAWCGGAFVGKTGSRYCSSRCSANASWKRKYDARGEFYINPRVRQEIYERDAWTCQICHTPVPRDATPGDLEYPTLDHIIPQSLQLIPDHSPSALRLAHMVCNARRGNRMDYEATA